MSELVTGDAVVLGLRPARVASRALAICIDLLLLWSCYLLLLLLLVTAVSGLDSAATAAVSVALLVLTLMGVPAAVETLTHGRSPGKLALGLRVVREDGGPIRFRHALVRSLLGFAEIQLSLGAVACVSSIVSDRGRRLGDVFAGTLVVRERNAAEESVAMPAPPPWLESYLRALDLSRIPDALWLAVRQYLMRSAHLDPETSRSMAERLGSDVAAYTGTPPPGGLPAFGYLTGVLAERQARDARRAYAPTFPTPPAHGSGAPAPGAYPGAPDEGFREVAAPAEAAPAEPSAEPPSEHRPPAGGGFTPPS